MGYKSGIPRRANSKFIVGDKVICSSSKPVIPACNGKVGQVVGVAESIAGGWEYRVKILSAKGQKKHRYLYERELKEKK